MSYSALLSMLQDVGQTERTFKAEHLGGTIAKEEHAIKRDALALQKEIKRIERENRKKGKRSGWGRLGGTILGALVGGPIGAGVGSYAGSAIGGRGDLSDARSNFSTGLFGKGKRQKLQNELSEVQSMIDEANTSKQQQYIMQAAGDAITTAMLMNTFGIESRGSGKIPEWFKSKFPKLLGGGGAAEVTQGSGMLGPPGTAEAVFGGMPTTEQVSKQYLAAMRGAGSTPLLSTSSQIGNQMGGNLPPFMRNTLEQGIIPGFLQPLMQDMGNWNIFNMRNR
jgi:hypothetical protein